MKGWRTLVVVAAVLVLAGCGGRVVPAPKPPADQDGDGVLVVRLTREGMTPQAVAALEEEPIHVRVRVYGPGFSLLENRVILPGEAPELAVTVPAGTGYTVDAVVFDLAESTIARVLEAGRAEGVRVLAEQVTETLVQLEGYTATFTAPEAVTEGFEFAIEVVLQGPNIWWEGYLKLDDEPWFEDELVGGIIGHAGIVDSGPDWVKVRYRGFAPAVDEPTTYYYAVSVWAKPEYYDVQRGIPVPAVFAPSVAAGEPLRTITVNPL